MSAISSRQTRSIAGASRRVLGGDPRHDRVEHAPAPAAGPTAVDRQRRCVVQLAEELRLDRVEERAAGQRIELLQRLGFLRGLEPVDRGQQELIRAAREFLQRGERVGACAEPLRRQQLAGHAGDSCDPVERRPRRSRARPPGRHRSLQRLVQPQQVVRMPADALRVVRQQQLRSTERSCSRSSIASGGLARCRPGKTAQPPAAAARSCSSSWFGNAPGDRAHDVERIERRHARP